MHNHTVRFFTDFACKTLHILLGKFRRRPLIRDRNKQEFAEIEVRVFYIVRT